MLVSRPELGPLIDGRSVASQQIRNELLMQLPVQCREDIIARAERVFVKRRHMLLERNVPLRYAYFIESGAAAMFATVSADRASVEIRMLGAGDFVGIPLVLGGEMSPHGCTVQVPGEVWRIPAEDFLSLIDETPELRRLLLQYVHKALIHSSQLVACNTRHSLRERLARWLLVASDRLNSAEIALTHQVIGRALAVRRAGVTTEIGRMEEAGMIRRHRGCISIVDRERLENTSCNCQRVLRALPSRRLSCTVADVPASLRSRLGRPDVIAPMSRQARAS